MSVVHTTSNAEAGHNKTITELTLDAMWFTIHTVVAVTVLALVMGAVSLLHPDSDDLTPKLIGTALAFFAPMLFGYVIARRQQNDIAGYVWISGLLTFSVVCVWVLDLPTGNGLCEKCGAVEKLWRTFFDITHGSGLMGGDGLFVGTWVPLSMIGYAVGANLGIDA